MFAKREQIPKGMKLTKSSLGPMDLKCISGLPFTHGADCQVLGAFAAQAKVIARSNNHFARTDFRVFHADDAFVHGYGLRCVIEQ